MNNSPVTEPSAILISMSLTALSATYIDFTKLDSIHDTYRIIVASIIFIFAGTSSSQLYFSLIIPKLKEQISFPLIQRRSTKLNCFVRNLSLYILITMKFFTAQCNVREIRLLGYLNSIVAFSILLLAQLIHTLERIFSIVIFLSKLS